MTKKLQEYNHHKQGHLLLLHKSWYFLLFIQVICSLVALALADVVDKDKNALLQLKSAIIEDPLGLTSNWNPKDTDFCSWYGVTCDPVSRRVTALNLSSDLNHTCSLLSLSATGGNFSLPFSCRRERVDNNSSSKLKGQLSPAIGGLTQLRVLLLGFNGFFGELPLEIGRLSLLEILDLGFNAFYGPIPLTLQNCTSLRVINLSGNQLNGTIPEFFGHFTGLQVVSLWFNFLSGSIPQELGENCGSLEHIHLAGNLLSGSIPSNLGNCIELRSLILSSNRLQDDIPASFGQLLNLEVLDLSQNFLSGVVPPELGNCKQLKVLVLKNSYDPLFSRDNDSLPIQPVVEGEKDFNFFDGLLPDSITRLPNLSVLWAPSINLEGTFPQNWESCSKLEMLNLAQNFLTGQIPASFGKCKNLYFLDLSSNNLTGLVPEEISVPCMVFFNVSQNFLSGDIHKFSHGECSKMYVNLSMSHVDFLGLYKSFFYSNALTTIAPLASPSNGLVVLHDFSSNLFTGPLPPLLIHSADFPSKPFYGFWFGGNNLKGNISTYSFDLCRSLHGLIFDIGKNKIIGELPLDMGSHCRCMKFLSLAGNEFVGQVPKTFANLDSLVNLNLSRNQLQGVIPSYIGKLKNLKYFSLSSNNFTGAIPRELVQLTSLEVLELSWNSFSGEIPPDLIKLENLNILRLDHNNFTGKIPTGFSTTASLSLFDVSFNNLSGPVPQNSNSIKCENVQGNPNLQPCHDDPSSSEWEQQHSGGISQQDANSPTGSMQRNSSVLNPIEIASITSATIIFSVLVALVLLLVCMKKFSCNSVADRGSVRKEVVIFHNIGAQLTYENVVRATAGFNVQNCIGSGGFGATYKAEISPGVVVAVKRLSVGRFQGDQQFDAEIKTLGRVQHPNLVTLIGYHVSEGEMFLIYNYLPGGNLEKFIQERPRRNVEWMAWASMLLLQGRPSEFFTAGLWDSGPHDDLIEMLHLAITCTAESRSTRPFMRQVAQRLKQIQPPS
ncbi:hypothetical protein Pint_00728 [Pistacia integerrima]|uniref:Uncharacterized protein n=1 Tax=Pistacia integerrima TaxID=434235 RepID=A0ACC0ZEU2_9ROSI|nr:hypothetical protein Pint_00728 [Pistacia integerrima]